MVLSTSEHDKTIITLLPNRSASWAETRLFIFLICGTTLAIGVFWAIVGVWAVLPFSGLEAALVAWLIYRVSRNSYQRQVITCGPDTVLIQFGMNFPQRSWTLERPDTHLAITEATHHLSAPNLNIFDKHHSIEVGQFLNKDDKDRAIAALKQAGLHVRGHSPESSRQF